MLKDDLVVENVSCSQFDPARDGVRRDVGRLQNIIISIITIIIIIIIIVITIIILITITWSALSLWGSVRLEPQLRHCR